MSHRPDSAVRPERIGAAIHAGRRGSTPPRYDVTVLRDVPVVMDDGTSLATDIYLPAAGDAPLHEPVPALLHRTPYGRVAVEEANGYCRWFAARGYAAAIQDVRGTFGSGGRFRPFTQEGSDGAHTVRWLVDQSWSSGVVGTWGASYASFAQTALAAESPQGLAAMVLVESAANAWRSSIRQNGAFELRWLAWAFWHSARNANRDRVDQPELMLAMNDRPTLASEWLTRLPLRRGASQLSLASEYEDWLFEVMTASDCDGCWLDAGYSPDRYFDRFPAMDVLVVGGWYDSYAGEIFELFNGLRSDDRHRCQIVVGPWTHGPYKPEGQTAGDVDFGASASIGDMREVHLAWFDRSIRGQQDRWEHDDQPISIFVMGGGSGDRGPDGRLRHGGAWRTEAQWPPTAASKLTLFLHADGSLGPHRPSEAGSSTTYRYDPARPVPTIGGNVSSLDDVAAGAPGVGWEHVGGTSRRRSIVAAGGFDQVEGDGVFGCARPFLPLASRRDVLVFRTGPLDTEIEICGSIEVVLWAASSAVDTDFTAKLVDEHPSTAAYPKGYALNVSDGIVRLRYHRGGTAQLVKPQEVVTMTIALPPTCNRFGRGHRIRLDISSSNFPRFDVNPNTGEPCAQERRMQVADNTVFHDAVRSSHVVLPCG